MEGEGGRERGGGREGEREGEGQREGDDGCRTWTERKRREKSQSGKD